MLKVFAFPLVLYASIALGFDFPELKKAPLFSSEQAARTLRGYSPSWVCGPSNRLEMECDNLGSDSDNDKAHNEELILSVLLNSMRHEYGLRHGIPASECQKLMVKIDRLLRKNETFCIVGDFAGHEQVDGVDEYSWVFFEIKTATGSVCDPCEWPAVQGLADPDS